MYITQYFPPEVGATQTRAFEMATNLKKLGHEVTVLTEFPNHPTGIIPPEYNGRLFEKKVLDGIHVVRTWVYARPVKTFKTRMGFYLSFMFMGIIVGSFLKGPFDIVYTTSPPFFTGVIGIWTSWIKKAKFVFEVRDLWPQSAVELGELKNKRFIRWAEKLEAYYYKKAVKIIAVTSGIKDTIINRGFANVELVSNGSNTELFYNTGPVKRSEFGGNNKFIVMYAGILGLAQGMEQLCELVESFKFDSRIQFVFIGDGPLYKDVAEIKNKKDLFNLKLLGEVSREEVPYYLSSADCCLVPLKKNPLFLGALPSKMFDCMACERPVILSVNGEARKVLEKSGGGIYVEPENTIEMKNAINKLLASPNLCKKLGQAGRAFVEKKFSRQQKAAQLEKILLDV